MVLPVHCSPECDNADPGMRMQSAISCCRRLLQVFQAPENVVPIQQELLAARYRGEAFWNQRLNYDNSQGVYGEHVGRYYASW